MTKSLVIALENRHELLIESTRFALAAYSQTNPKESIDVVPVSPAPTGVLSEVIPLIKEGARRAELVRAQESAAIGVGIAGGLVSVKAKNPRERLCFETLFAVAVAQEGYLSVCVAGALCPKMAFEQLNADIALVHAGLWNENKTAIPQGLVDLGMLITENIANCYGTSESVEAFRYQVH